MKVVLKSKNLLTACTGEQENLMNAPYKLKTASSRLVLPLRTESEPVPEHLRGLKGS